MPRHPFDSAPLGRFLRDGDEAALRAFVAEVAPWLYRVARGLTAWRVVGAQTVAERAWRAALARAAELTDDPAVRRVLLDEVVRCAAAVGDSPRPRHADEPEPRRSAMRAVALLPPPARQVYVLHELACADLATVAQVLPLPDAQVRAELWHARLAVSTLAGDALPQLDGDAETEDVAPVWLEPAPPELVAHMVETALHRRPLGGRSAWGGRW